MVHSVSSLTRDFMFELKYERKFCWEHHLEWILQSAIQIRSKLQYGFWTLWPKKKAFWIFSFFLCRIHARKYVSTVFSLYVLLIVVTLKILYKAPFGNILQIILSCLLYNCNFLGYNYICDDPTFGLGQDLRIIWFDSFFLFDLDFEVKYLG